MPVIHMPSSMTQSNLDVSASAMNKYLKSGKDAFVLIYMDGCGPCSATHPKWKELASTFKNQDDIGVFDIEMSKLNAITHEGLKKNIAGYPTMRHIHGSSTSDYEDCKDISHDRTHESFLEWIEKETKHKKTHKTTSQNGGARKTKRRRMRTGGRRRWSQKYKRSINCRRPRGFSQRQFCRGRAARKSR